MPIYKPRNSNIPALTLLFFFTFGSTSFAETSEIALPSDRAYPESVASAPDGTLYVGSPAVGGVWRIKTSSGAVEQWIKPGAFGSRSTLGRVGGQQGQPSLGLLQRFFVDRYSWS